MPAGTTVPHSWFFSGEVFPFWAFPLPNEVWSWLVKLRQCDFRHPPLSLWDYTESVCHLWGLRGCSRVFLPPWLWCVSSFTDMFCDDFQWCSVFSIKIFHVFRSHPSLLPFLLLCCKYLLLSHSLWQFSACRDVIHLAVRTKVISY